MLRGVHIGDDLRRFRLCAQYYNEIELEFYKTRALIMSNLGDPNLVSKTLKDYTDKVFPVEKDREKFVRDNEEILRSEEAKTYQVEKIEREEK